MLAPLLVALLLLGGCREEGSEAPSEDGGTAASSTGAEAAPAATHPGALPVDTGPGALAARGAPSTGEAPPPEPGAPDSEAPMSPTSPSAAAEAPALPPVTPARIDAFLAYQSRRLELEKALWADLAAEEARDTRKRRRARNAAPADATAPTAASLRRLEQRAEDDAEALEAAGLTPAELVALQDLIREVLAPRQLALELALEETVTLLEEQAERLEGAQREELLAQVGPLKERMTTLRSLVGVRAVHGDAAVDAVLAREEALLAWQEARLTTLLQHTEEEGEGQAGDRR